MIVLDQNVRDRATYEIDINLSVEAGAGTGKTSLLTKRYLQIVRSGKNSPAEIAAITFTELAAQELSERIRSELKANPIAAVKETDILNAPITTIHGFAANLLRIFPFKANVHPNFEILQDMTLGIFLDDGFTEWFARIFPENQELLQILFGFGFHHQKLKKLFFKIYAERDLYRTIPNLHEKKSGEDFFRPFQVAVRDLFSFAEVNCRDFGDAGFAEISDLSNRLNLLVSLPPGFLDRALMEQIEMSSAKGKQASWETKEFCKQFKERWEDLRFQLEEWKLHQRTYYFGRLFNLAQDFLIFIEEKKRVGKKLDFQDLLIKARDLVRDFPETRSYLANKYRTYLVDEFQDTDPLQAELIWHLCVEEGRLKPGKLFLVGDPKQSIYRFRRASIETYRKLTEPFKNAEEHLVIQQNFRTKKNLLEWINLAFSDVLAENYHNLITPEEDDITQRVLILEDPLEKADSSAMAKRRESLAIAHWISETHSHGRAYDDIAVLYPSRTALDHLESALRGANIPFSVLGGSNFYERHEIRDLIVILEAILYPAHAISVVAALKSGYFGYTDEEIYGLESAVGFDFRVSPEATLAFTVLNQCHTSAKDQPLSKTLLLFWELSWAAAALKLRAHADQALINIKKLLGLILEYEATVSVSPYGCFRWLKNKALSEDKEEEAPLNSTGSGVKLMTIHQSKGLEFPVVVLYQLSYASKSQNEWVMVDRVSNQLEAGLGEKGSRFATPNYEAVAERNQAEGIEEKKRLLYVACTRAKAYLVLPHFPFAKEQKNSFRNLLHSGMEKAAARGQRLKARLDPLSDLKKHETSTPEAVFAEKANFETFVQEYSRREEMFQAPYVLVHPSEYAEKIEATQGLLSPWMAKSIGSSFHRVFEQKPWDQTMDLEKLCRWAATEQGVPELQHELLKISGSALKHDIWNQVRAAEEVYCEMPFSWLEEESLVEGFMDLVFKHKGQWYVLDYKTNQYKPEKQPELIAQYTPQIKTYTKALQKILATEQIIGLLFFVRAPEVITVG